MRPIRRLDLRIAAGTVAVVALTAFLLLDLGGNTGQLRLYWSTVPFIDAFLFWSAAVISRRPGISPAERRLWRAVALMMFLIFTGDAVQAAAVWIHPAPKAVTTLYTASCNTVGMVPVLVALLTFRTGAAVRTARTRYLLDAASVAVGTGVIMWFAPSMTVSSLDRTGWMVTATALAVMTFGALKLILSGVLHVRRSAGALIGLGGLVQTLSVGVLSPVAEVSLPLAGLALSGGMIAIGMGLHMLDRTARRNVGAPRLYSLLPYATLALMYCLVPVTVHGGVDLDFWVIIVGLVAVNTLVVARQILAFRENANLLLRLDSSLTEARDLHEQLRFQASHDALTGLANRALFDERLATATGPAAVLLVDLDKFKEVNDVHGHHAGDAVLIAVADRLRRAVPASATAARLGGDEFAVLLTGYDNDAARRVAERFETLLREPVHVDGLTLRTQASVGIAAGIDVAPADLVRLADEAMYRRKRAGRREEVLVA